MALNFHNRGNASAGKFSARHARDEFGKISSRLGLTDKTREHFIRELDRGGNITGHEFNQIVDDAHKKGIVSSRHAEEIKDITKLPDNYNKQWD